MPYLNYRDDIKIYYRVTGKGEPILLIQGLGHKSTGWQLQVPYFRKKGFKVIYYDNIGVGKSSRPNFPYSMELYVDIIKRLFEEINIKEKVHICGISMGGMIAQHFAIKYPELTKSLILIATSPKCEVKPLIDMIKTIDDYPEDKKLKILLPTLFSRNFIKQLKSNEGLYEMIKADFLENPTTAQDYINQAKAIAKHDTRQLLNKIEVPTLILVGTKDMLLPLNHSKILHEGIKNSELVIIEGAGHALIIEAAEKVNKIIYNFIKNLNTN